MSPSVSITASFFLLLPPQQLDLRPNPAGFSAATCLKCPVGPLPSGTPGFIQIHYSVYVSHTDSLLLTDFLTCKNTLCSTLMKCRQTGVSGMYGYRPLGLKLLCSFILICPFSNSQNHTLTELWNLAVTLLGDKCHFSDLTCHIISIRSTWFYRTALNIP